MTTCLLPLNGGQDGRCLNDHDPTNWFMTNRSIRVCFGCVKLYGRGDTVDRLERVRKEWQQRTPKPV